MNLFQELTNAQPSGSNPLATNGTWTFQGMSQNTPSSTTARLYVNGQNSYSNFNINDNIGSTHNPTVLFYNSLFSPNPLVDTEYGAIYKFRYTTPATANCPSQSSDLTVLSGFARSTVTQTNTSCSYGPVIQTETSSVTPNTCTIYYENDSALYSSTSNVIHQSSNCTDYAVQTITNTKTVADFPINGGTQGFLFRGYEIQDSDVDSGTFVNQDGGSIKYVKLLDTLGTTHTIYLTPSHPNYDPVVESGPAGNVSPFLLYRWDASSLSTLIFSVEKAIRNYIASLGYSGSLLNSAANIQASDNYGSFVGGVGNSAFTLSFLYRHNPSTNWFGVINTSTIEIYKNQSDRNNDISSTHSTAFRFSSSKSFNESIDMPCDADESASIVHNIASVNNTLANISNNMPLANFTPSIGSASAPNVSNKTCLTPIYTVTGNVYPNGNIENWCLNPSYKWRINGGNIVSTNQSFTTSSTGSYILEVTCPNCQLDNNIVSVS